MERPWFPFYTRDWRSDVALRSLPPAARGLWIDLLTLMHEGSPYGHLAQRGTAIPDATASSLLGYPLPIYTELLSTLEQAEVCSRTVTGILFSRRMVRDEEIRVKRALAGRSGGRSSAQGRKFAQANGQASAQARSDYDYDSNSTERIGVQRKGENGVPKAGTPEYDAYIAQRSAELLQQRLKP